MYIYLWIIPESAFLCHGVLFSFLERKFFEHFMKIDRKKLVKLSPNVVIL